MVDISKINDRKTLEAWLDTQPREVQAQIGFRAAARVMPIWWTYAQNRTAEKRDLTRLPILRSILTSSVALGKATEDVRRAAYASASSASASSTASTATAAAAASSTAASTAAAFAAASASASSASASSAASSAYASSAYASASTAAASSSAFATAAAAVIWKAIRVDVDLVETGQGDLWSAKLWHDAENPFGGLWSDLKGPKDARESHAFWIAWYDGLLAGKPMPRDLLTSIALIGKKDESIWERPDEANALINKLWREFPIQQEKSIQKISKTQIQKTKSAVTENKTVLPPTLEALQELIILEMSYWQTNNELNVKVPEQCRRQVLKYCEMLEAIEGIKGLIPTAQNDEEVSDKDAEVIVGLGTLYLNKYKSIVSEKKDHIVEGSLVGLTAGAFAMFGMSPMAGVALGALAFARPDVDKIIAAAKLFGKPETE